MARIFPNAEPRPPSIPGASSFDNGDDESTGIDVKWGNTTLAGYSADTSFLPGQDNDFADVAIRLHPDGTLDVSYRCVPIFTRLPLPGYTPLLGARFGLGGRTGGWYETHSIDDLAVQLTTDPATSVTPPRLRDLMRLANGSVQLSFTNSPGAPFTVLTSTNLALPSADWLVLGTPTETSPGRYQFTDSSATNSPQRYYLVRSP